MRSVLIGFLCVAALLAPAVGAEPGKPAGKCCEIVEHLNSCQCGAKVCHCSSSAGGCSCLNGEPPKPPPKPPKAPETTKETVLKIVNDEQPTTDKLDKIVNPPNLAFSNNPPPHKR